MDSLLFVLTVGATMRLCRLVMADTITERPVRWIVDHSWVFRGFLVSLLTCPWCMSIWVAGAVSVASYTCGDTLWFKIPATLLTASLVTSLFAKPLGIEGPEKPHSG